MWAVIIGGVGVSIFLTWHLWDVYKHSYVGKYLTIWRLFNNQPPYHHLCKTAEEHLKIIQQRTDWSVWKQRMVARWLEKH